MPLRGKGEPAVDFFQGAAIEFKMTDDHGEVVFCRLLDEALRDFGPAPTPRLDAFEKHRKDIETVASDCFDRHRFTDDGKTVIIKRLDVEWCRQTNKIPWSR